MNTAMKIGSHCPGCRRPQGPTDEYCNGCGIWLAGSQGAELRWIDAELERVDAARTWLISRRAALLEELSAIRRQSAPKPASARPTPEPRFRPVPRPEMSVRTAARLLLAAGVALVVIAVIVFTVANWATIGPLGRFGILLAATAIVLAAPPVLIRRGLNATAESVAAIGLGLTIADAFLLARLSSFPGGLIGAAAGTAALAGLWAAYGATVKLAGPKVAAIGIGQLPLPLAAAGVARLGHVPPLAGSIAVALIADSAAGLVVMERAERRGQNAEAVAACVAAAVTWTCGILVAVALAATGGPSGPIWLAIALVSAAAVALAGPRGRLAAVARPAGGASGALLAVGLAAPLTEVLAGGWSLAALCGSAGLVFAVAGSLGRKYARAEFAAAGAAVVLAGTGLVALPAAIAGLFPARWPPAWSGSAAPAASIWPGIQPAAAVLALTALGCWVARSPASVRTRPAGTVAAALAFASLPAAAHLAGWTALAAPTAAVVMLLAVGTAHRPDGTAHRPRGTTTSTAPTGDEVLARVSMTAAIVLAVSAALRSLEAPAETIGALAALTVAFGAAAALARRAFGAAVATGGALAAATGLACALPLSYGWPARYAALAALGPAVVAVAVSTRLRHSRPVHSAVLDLGAAAIALLCAALTAGWRDEFALLAVAAALTASIAAWLRTGVRRQLTVLAAGCAALGALLAQWQPLARALLVPARLITHPWHGHATAGGSSPGLTMAVVVLAVCLAALVTAAGAWRGSGRASMDALAFALPVVVAPAGVAGAAGLPGALGYWVTVLTLLALAVALTAWAVLGQNPIPAAAALVAAALAMSWALAAPGPTLVVLGTLTIVFPLAAWRARQAGIKAAAAGLSVVVAAGLAECAVLAAGGADWQAGMAVLAVAAVAQLAAQLAAAQLAAARLDREQVSLAVEAVGWLAAAVGVGQCLHRPEAAALALAVAGLICLGVAARSSRRATVWPACALLYAAWCRWLVAAGVNVAELYTVPAAVIAIAFGMSRCRRDPELGSWLTLGPGLALALVPSLIGVWTGSGWIRPALLGLAAAGVALAGARTTKQAPLVIGIVLVVLDAGRALTPAFLALIHAVPGWIPIGAVGAVLLWAGATYEARLRNVRAIRGRLAAMN